MPEVKSVKIFQIPPLSYEEKQIRIEELRSLIEGKMKYL